MDASYLTASRRTRSATWSEKSVVEKLDRAPTDHFGFFEIQEGIASLKVDTTNEEPEVIHELIRGSTKYTFRRKGLSTRITKEEIYSDINNDDAILHDENIQKGKPVGEGKKAWPCACGHPDHDVIARIVEVHYQPPAYSTKRTLRIPASANLPVGELKFGVEHVFFEKDFIVKDSHLRQIARGPPAFRASLRALTCGDAKLRTEATDTFTDRQITELARSCPNLEVIDLTTPGLQLTETSNSIDPSTRTPAFQTILKTCYKLQSLNLSATRSSPGTLDPKILHPLKDRSLCKSLQYLVLQNLEVEDEFGLAVLLKGITKRRRGLEIAHGWMGVVYLYREGESYLLERDLEECPEMLSEESGSGDESSGDGAGEEERGKSIGKDDGGKRGLGQRLFRLF